MVDKFVVVTSLWTQSLSRALLTNTVSNWKRLMFSWMNGFQYLFQRTISQLILCVSRSSYRSYGVMPRNTYYSEVSVRHSPAARTQSTTTGRRAWRGGRRSPGQADCGNLGGNECRNDGVASFLGPRSRAASQSWTWGSAGHKQDVKQEPKVQTL